jgi:predicted metal-dependent peptidase
MRTPVPNETLVAIGSTLEDYHKVFYTFWQMSSVHFTDELPTAAVQFVKNSPPILLLNQAFWCALSLRMQQFVILHECLHVLLDHFKRNGQHIRGATPRLVNVAQDITINEMIIDLFGFDRNEIENWQRFCWIDTCFKEPSGVKRNQSFLYYLALLVAEKNADGSSKSDDKQTVDEHGDAPGDQSDGEAGNEGGDGSGGGGDDDAEEARDRAAGALAKEMDAGDLADMLKAGGANEECVLNGGGTSSGMFDVILEQKKPPKVDFRKIIEGVKRTKLKEKEKIEESFRREDRRFSEVMAAHPGVILPGRTVQTVKRKDKLHGAVFMDVSGSCLSQLSKFYDIIQAFRDEQEYFDCEFYLFDTTLQNITTKGKNYRVGGGTAFDIMEAELQGPFKEKYKSYPDIVIVITDGDGNKVEPMHPKRWLWLLTDHNKKTFIHSASRHMLIKNVIFQSSK